MIMWNLRRKVAFQGLSISKMFKEMNGTLEPLPIRAGNKVSSFKAVILHAFKWRTSVRWWHLLPHRMQIFGLNMEHGSILS